MANDVDEQRNEMVDNVDEQDLQEIRLALVMEGGVSLAVWEGGVTLEISRLVRGDSSAYSDLLRLTGSTARVDVIAGTSAGGMNGALLAAALSHGRPLTSVRDLWMRQGSFDALLRSPFEKNPPSLLQGDEYFLPRVLEAFEEVSTGRIVPPEEQPIRLTMTTSLLRGVRERFEDDFGARIPDINHAGEFRFVRDGARDDFAAGEAVHRLAIAARSTASFPFAFEPSYVPIASTTEKPARPDMAGFTNFTTSQYTLDGGVLVNKPFEAAIRDVFALPAERQVRRVLAFLSPDPEQTTGVPEQKPTEVPSLLQVALDSAIRLPRSVSISTELNSIKEHNRRVREQQRRRQLVLGLLDSKQLEALAGRFLDAYWELKGQEWAAVMAARLPGWLAGPDISGEAEDLRSALRAELYQAWLAEAPNFDVAKSGALDEQWSWDVESVQRAALVVLDLLKRALALTSPEDEATAEQRERLRLLRGRVHDQLAVLRNVRAARLDLFSYSLPAVQGDPPADRAELSTWAEQAVAQWSDLGASLPDAARAIATILVQAREDIATIAEHASTRAELIEPAQTVLDMMRPLVYGPERSRDAEIDACFRRLLAVEIVTSVVGADRVLEQPVQLIQISTNTPNSFDDRDKGNVKVAGIQLAHFAAFYKRSWRANDWMWGRLDGAMKLTQLLLDPARLRQRRLSARAAADALEAIATGPEELHEATVAPELAVWDRDIAEQELSFLDHPATPVPRVLPHCTNAVARRLQIEILREEILGVEAAVRHDLAQGAKRTDDAGHFADQAAEVRERMAPDKELPDAADAARLFHLCKLGRERVTDDMGSDLFSSTVSTSAAVGVSAATGARSGLPRGARAALKSLRGIVLLLYGLFFAAVRGSRTTFAISVAALAVGGALLALSVLDVGLPGIFVGIAVAVLLTGAVLAVSRSKVWIIAAAVLLAAVLALAAFTERGEPEILWVPLAVVSGFVTSAVLVGAALNRPPKSGLAGPSGDKEPQRIKRKTARALEEAEPPEDS